MIRRTAPNSRACKLIGCLLLLPFVSSVACATEPPAQTLDVDATADLDVLVDEFIGRGGGRGSGDWNPATLRETGAPDFSPARFDARVQPLRDLLDRVETIDPDALTLPERNDRRTMIALLESDIYNAERRREWEMQPAMYVPV